MKTSKPKRVAPKGSKVARDRTVRDLPARRGQTVRGGGRGGSASKIQN